MNYPCHAKEEPIQAADMVYLCYLCHMIRVEKVYAPQSVPSYSDMQVCCVHTFTTEAGNLLIKRAFSFYNGGIVTLGNFGVSINRMIFCHAPFPFHSSNNIVRRTE